MSTSWQSSRSFCLVDGSLYIPTDKASLMRLIEEANLPPQPETPPAIESLYRILVTDAIWPSFKVTITAAATTTTTTIIIIIFCTKSFIYDLYTGLKKTRVILKISDLQESFIKRIERMVSGFDESRVVFDRYLESSLKNKTCQKGPQHLSSSRYIRK